MKIDEELTEFYNEDDEPIKCEKCGNIEEWIVAFSMVYAEVKDGKVYSNGQKPITKPDDILWICGKCKYLVLEGCW